MIIGGNMNLYVVRGKENDGTQGGWMGFTTSVTLFADNEEEAIQIVQDDNCLFGEPSDWKVELVTPERGIIFKDEYYD